MIALKNNRKRAKAAIILLAVSIVFEVILFSARYYQYGYLSNSIIDSTIEAYVLLIQLITLLISIFAGIFFLRWFRRASHNLHLLTDQLNLQKNGQSFAGGCRI